MLGALSVRPMTGYALREAIRDVLGSFWSEEASGRSTRRLPSSERGGYAERRDSARPGCPMFAITPSGTARLRPAFPAGESSQCRRWRNGLMLHLFFGRQLGPEAGRALVLEARADAERRLAQYQSIRQELIEEQEDREDRPYWLLTVSAGEHTAQAAIAWADEALDALSKLDQARAGAPATHGEDKKMNAPATPAAARAGKQPRTRAAAGPPASSPSRASRQHSRSAPPWAAPPGAARTST